jgi:lantibiotic transport system ATP-binding protein
MLQMEIPVQHIIQTHALSFSYGNLKVLNNINLQVPSGSIFGFLGPNGAGKSTTIKALLGLLHTDPGMIRIFGKELNTSRMYILSRIGAMVESPSLYDHLNAYRNLEITARMRNLSFDRIKPLLDTVSLTRDARRPVKQYSTGMKQRLSLAVALLAQPDLLILDEPINGLDPNGIMEMRLLLSRINKEQNCTILLSSHILSEIEKLCSDVAIINSGSLAFQGSTQTLLKIATGREVIAIHTDDATKAKELMDGRFESLIRDHNLIISVSSRSEAAYVIRKLVENSIEVYSAERETTGLEASFLHLLNENQQS